MELCGPAGCSFKEGPEECFERTQTVVGDKPEESCNLDPQTTCKHVTKLAPRLEEVEVCFDVPKEVCVRSEVNPRKVAQPVVKKWCYVPQCDNECKEAAAKGECLPQCETYRGNDKCCAPCPSACLSAAAARQQCSRECQRYSDNQKCCYNPTTPPKPPNPPMVRTTPPPGSTTCPSDCAQAFRRRQTLEKCKKYEDEYDNCYYKTPTPTCPSDCAQAFGRRETLAKCNKYKDKYNDCYYETPTTTPMTTSSTTTKIPTCPSDCAQAFRRSEILAKCKKYKDKYSDCYYEATSTTSIPGTSTSGPTPSVRTKGCPVECQKDAALGFCSSKCKEFEGKPDCCAPKCPAKCTNKRR